MPAREPTANELRKLHVIEATRKQAVILVLVAAPSLLLILQIPDRHSTMKMYLAVSLVVIMLSVLVYISFFLRCPRCAGWVAIPKCPACGLTLHRQTKP